MVKWEPTTSRFVAFLDMMGFTNKVFRSSHGDVLETMQKFQLAIGVIEQEVLQKLQPVSLGESPTPFLDFVANGSAKSPTPFLDYLERDSVVEPVFFSDSILLASNDGSEGSARHMLRTVMFVMEWAMYTGIPLKGAIAYGEQTDDFPRSLHFGRPLIDAYQLQNELCLYGVALHHSAQEHLTVQGFMKNLDGLYLHDYLVPLKAGPVHHYLVAHSTQFLANGLHKVAISKFYSTVSGAPRIYVDNTAKYLDWLAQKAGKPSETTPKQ